VKPTLVVPCFNEESRFSVAGWAEVAKHMHLVCVDDGSSDGTRALLEELAALSDGVTVLALARNSGKANAVRQGMLFALEMGSDVVGFADADLATPGHELVRLATDLVWSKSAAVIGSRKTAAVERNAIRGLMGRIFAGVASFVIGSHFDDTQCGAKFFRASQSLRDALSTPFSSRWSFDVELLARLLRGRDGLPAVERSSIRELALTEWNDVEGSKLTFRAALRSGLDLLAIPAQVTAWQSERALPVMAIVGDDEAPPVSGVFYAATSEAANDHRKAA